MDKKKIGVISRFKIYFDAWLLIQKKEGIDYILIDSAEKLRQHKRCFDDVKIVEQPLPVIGITAGLIALSLKPYEHKERPEPYKESLEYAKDIYMSITCYSPRQELGGIDKDWILKCIAWGLEDFLTQHNTQQNEN